MKQLFKIGDIFIYCVVLLFILIGIFGAKWLARGEYERQVIVEVDGRIIEKIPMSVDTIGKEFTIETGNGGYNVIRIDDKGVSIIDANCPDKICIHEGWIQDPGQVIVCLPHKMVVKIEGTNVSNNGVDDIVK
ncbi:NusG domain II-containing protein [Xylanivirga thermophila]|jgi:hypothetical protein|uniref:NusG domain II-containing protein n=1 Tax=Xylanivirga thermophila TaxID=2496273 RepID=UPI00101C8362|nr:NusG domain II-containing protein [Xylanivirga thermophila]